MVRGLSCSTTLRLLVPWSVIKPVCPALEGRFLIIKQLGKSLTPIFSYQLTCLIAQLCLTLYNPTDYSLPGSSVHRILQARILEWVVIPFSKGIFPIQGSKPGILHCKYILYNLSHHGSPFELTILLFQTLPIYTNGKAHCSISSHNCIVQTSTTKPYCIILYCINHP